MLTGAPILLLNLIKCLKKAGYISDRVIIKINRGVLIEEFKKEAEILFFDNGPKNNPTGILKPITRYAAIIKETRNRKKIKQWINEADIIFSNTITNGDFLSQFGISKNQILISYIHELQFASDYYSNEKDRKIVLEKSNIFFTPSEAVKSFLLKDLGVDSSKIKKLNYFIPSPNESQNTEVFPLKRKFIIGLIGTLDWRKGADILPIIVFNFFNKYPDADVEFYWKGASKASIEYDHIIFELQKIDLQDKVIFEEPTLMVTNFYSIIDVLLLCSKEDPYPLVVLEAASFKKPSICFDKSGGAAEFIKGDAGSIIPYLNINQLTETIYEYYNERKNCIKKGNIAFERFKELHNNEILIQEQFNRIFS